MVVQDSAHGRSLVFCFALLTEKMNKAPCQVRQHSSISLALDDVLQAADVVECRVEVTVQQPGDQDILQTSNGCAREQRGKRSTKEVYVQGSVRTDQGLDHVERMVLGDRGLGRGKRKRNTFKLHVAHQILRGK